MELMEVGLGDSERSQWKYEYDLIVSIGLCWRPLPSFIQNWHLPQPSVPPLMSPLSIPPCNSPSTWFSIQASTRVLLPASVSLSHHVYSRLLSAAHTVAVCVRHRSAFTILLSAAGRWTNLSNSRGGFR